MISRKTPAFHGRWYEARASSSGRMDHDPMYAEPNLVIDVVLEAARETLSQ